MRGTLTIVQFTLPSTSLSPWLSLSFVGNRVKPRASPIAPVFRVSQLVAEWQCSGHVLSLSLSLTHSLSLSLFLSCGHGGEPTGCAPAPVFGTLGWTWKEWVCELGAFCHLLSLSLSLSVSLSLSSPHDLARLADLAGRPKAPGGAGPSNSTWPRNNASAGSVALG